MLHGSPEHIDAVRSLYSHHETQHNQLKEEHSDLFEKFERVRNELDVINDELHMLTGALTDSTVEYRTNELQTIAWPSMQVSTNSAIVPTCGRRTTPRPRL